MILLEKEMYFYRFLRLFFFSLFSCNDQRTNPLINSLVCQSNSVFSCFLFRFMRRWCNARRADLDYNKEKSICRINENAVYNALLWEQIRRRYSSYARTVFLRSK